MEAKHTPRGKGGKQEAAGSRKDPQGREEQRTPRDSATDPTEPAAGLPECREELASTAIIEAIISQMLDYDLEKVRRLKEAQDNAARHSRSEATRLMRESVNQFAFKNVDGGKRWDPVRTNEVGNLATQLKSIDERTDSASAD